MVNIAAEVAASISPKIRVMGPSVTATGEAYFQEFLEAGGLDRIDTITFHFPPGAPRASGIAGSRGSFGNAIRNGSSNSGSASVSSTFRT
ncbi:MAG: hypothetical protein L6W00_17540 [Lentisphaeria bacterium]|nr:MAG: hypothetical protein L6W00_17540 [Lentisphaeria bacterium]